MNLQSGIIIFTLVILLENIIVDSKSTKKTKDESAVLNKKLTGKTKKVKPAIIAIEIIDPNDNGTSSKNAKRTIDSALGYGYQPPPRYEVYKYSQRDIPPYQGSSHGLINNIQAHNFNFQKSVSYKLPANHQENNIQQYYQPGTTLFSAINDQGQVEELSPHLPQLQHQQYDEEPQVPVIILRVYPSQLSDPYAKLHPNLPATHPLAATINSIDIQSLLAKYVENLLVDQQHTSYQQPEYPVSEPAYQYSQPNQHDHSQELLTFENYPKDTHTQVIFNKNKVGPVDIHQPKALPEGFSNVQVQTPHMQYSYQSNQPHSYYYDNSHQDSVLQSYFYQQPAGNSQLYQYEQQSAADAQQLTQEVAQQYQQTSQDADQQPAKQHKSVAQQYQQIIQYQEPAEHKSIPQQTPVAQQLIQHTSSANQYQQLAEHTPVAEQLVQQKPEAQQLVQHTSSVNQYEQLAEHIPTAEQLVQQKPAVQQLVQHTSSVNQYQQLAEHTPVAEQLVQQKSVAQQYQTISEHTPIAQQYQTISEHTPIVQQYRTISEHTPIAQQYQQYGQQYSQSYQPQNIAQSYADYRHYGHTTPSYKNYNTYQKRAPRRRSPKPRTLKTGNIMKDIKLQPIKA